MVSSEQLSAQAAASMHAKELKKMDFALERGWGPSVNDFLLHPRETESTPYDTFGDPETPFDIESIKRWRRRKPIIYTLGHVAGRAAGIEGLISFTPIDLRTNRDYLFGMRMVLSQETYDRIQPDKSASESTESTVEHESWVRNRVAYRFWDVARLDFEATGHDGDETLPVNNEAIIDAYQQLGFIPGVETDGGLVTMRHLGLRSRLARTLRPKGPPPEHHGIPRYLG
jgi:hypothetical protein